MLRHWLEAGLAVLTCLLALVFLASPGTPDVGLWLAWVGNLEQYGVRAGYAANQSDYPPLTSVILWLMMRLASWLNVEPFWALKGTLLGFLYATTVIWWAWTRNLVAASLLQLSLILNSVGLGYLDILMAPPLILGLWALAVERWLLFGLLFGVSAFIKWQPLVLAPLLAVYIWRKLSPGRFKLARGGKTDQLKPKQARGGWSHPPQLIQALAGPLLVTLLVVVVFGGETLRALSAALAHPTLSGNALNLGWVITHGIRALSPASFGGLEEGLARYIQTDDWRLLSGPKVQFLLLYGLILLRCWRAHPRFETWLTYALAGYLAYFTFNTGVHENHLFLAVILAAALWAWGASGILFGVVALAANINLFVFYSIDGQGLWFSRVAWVDVALPLAVLYVLIFGGYCLATVRGLTER